MYETCRRAANPSRTQCIRRLRIANLLVGMYHRENKTNPPHLPLLYCKSFRNQPCRAELESKNLWRLRPVPLRLLPRLVLVSVTETDVCRPPLSNPFECVSFVTSFQRRSVRHRPSILLVVHSTASRQNWTLSETHPRIFSRPW